MRRTLSFLAATQADADAFLRRLSDLRLDVDLLPVRERNGQTAVIRVHGDGAVFMGEAEPGSYEANAHEEALVGELTRGLNITHDQASSATED